MTVRELEEILSKIKDKEQSVLTKGELNIGWDDIKLVLEIDGLIIYSQHEFESRLW